MPQRDDDAAHVIEFRQHQFACIGETVGIADPENLAAAVKIADRGRVFRPGV